MIGVRVTYTGMVPGTHDVVDVHHLFEYEEWMFSNRVEMFSHVARDGYKYMKEHVNLEFVNMDAIELIYE